ncbi:hypothetical protein [Sanyastnella coralliicola]|uniref:hypothetical protein n=1 Tax=Sanyastnella coralliicola TaxID=3069118 RepID=UPI0027BAD114|nr:hypothetical protein [Longitalea sp. SCSIO 12813]
MEKEKKPFKETGFGQFLSKAGKVVPGVAKLADEVLLGGKVSGVLDAVGLKIDGFEPKTEEDKTLKQQLAHELALKQLEFETELEKFQTERARIDAEDRDSARELEAAKVTAGRKNLTQNILAFIAPLGFLGVIFLFLSGVVANLDEGSQSLAHMLIGALATVFIQVYAYYFGSSAGSAFKNRFMSNNKNPNQK